MKHYRCLAPLALPVACGTSPKEPPVTVTVSVSASQMTVGEFDNDTIVLALRNMIADSVTLHFGTSCQYDIYIRNAAGQRVVPPPYDCLEVGTSLSLGPHETISHSRVWAGNADWVGNSSSPLPPGNYYVVASVVATGVTAQAAPVLIRLTAAP